MRNTSSHSRTRNRSFTVLAGALALLVGFTGSPGASESPEQIKVRAPHQSLIYFGGALASEDAAQSASPMGDSWLKSRDDVEMIDRDEFLGEVETNLTTSGFSERVDPFSGAVHLNMVDLVLPGNGGLDIVVQRYYNSQVWNRVDDDDILIARHTTSVELNGHLGDSGWQLHMGKLINFFAPADQEMTLIMPDGSMHMLYSINGNPDQRITPEGWLYSRDGSVFTVQTTTGLKYIFDRDESGADSLYFAMRDPVNPMYMIQCTRIEDLNGNAIVIEYSDFNYPGLGYGYGNKIERISFDDNNDKRKVEFEYHEDAVGTPTNIIKHMYLINDVTTIETWTFNFFGNYIVYHPQFPLVEWVTVNELVRVDHSIDGDFANQAVTNPWQFTYYDETTLLTEGKRLIKNVISPRLGKITYSWDAEVMETGGESCTGVEFLAIDERTFAVAIGQEPGGDIIYEDETTTDYTYTNPGLEDGSTSIVTKDSQTDVVLSTENYVFHGWTLPYDQFDDYMWKVGRQKSSTVVLKDDNGDDLETTTTTTEWMQGSQFSNRSRWSSLWLGCGSSREFGPQSYVKPASVTRVVERHDSIPEPSKLQTTEPDSYTTISSAFDDYGNVGSVSESSDDGLTRTTAITYWTEPTNNIMVGRVKGQDADPGGMQCYQYDTIGRLEHSYINPQSDEVADCTATGMITGARQTDLTYDSYGNLYTQTELSTPNIRVTTHTNYLYGKPTETVVTTGTGSNIHYCRDYKPRGMVAWETDGRGCSSDYRTVYEYDFLGRRTSADPPLSEAITYEYPTPSSIQALVTRGDRVMDYRFDRISNGNLTAIYKHIGASPTTTQLFAVTNDALGRRRQVQQLWDTRLGDLFSYDPMGRLTTITHSDDTQVTMDYAGSTVTVTDENNHVTSYVYAAFGDPNDRRLASLTDAGSFITTYSYDTVFGNLETVTAPIAEGNRSFTYYSNSTACNNGFLSGETHPESGTTDYAYNCLGDITTRTRAVTEITTYGYDSAGRLTDIDYSDSSSSVDITYDQASRRASVTNDNASTVFLYDNAGRLKTVTQSIFGGPESQQTIYSYDSLDRLQTMTYPSSRVVTYGWDDDNWLTSVTGADGSGVEYLKEVTHHVTGAIDLMKFGNTVETDHGIDTRNRLSTILTTAPGGQLLNVTFGYDAASNITTWDDHLGPNEDRTFVYDSLDRLTSANAPNLWGSLSYVYDALGNRESKTLDGSTTDYTYVSNRLDELENAEESVFYYDGAGRLVGEDRTLPNIVFLDGFESGDTSAWDSSALRNAPMVTYEWDYTFNEADQLVEVSRDSSVRGSYAYDGDNLRVSKTFEETTMYYLRNADGNTLAEYNQDNELIVEYIYANGRQIAKVVPDGAGGDDFRFFHADHLGSSLSITDGLGAVVWTGAYFPFGEAFSSEGEADRYRFTQHELDSRTGFLYAKARYYDPGIGRFLSVDPIEGNPQNSQSWNRYSYVLNNPQQYTDSTGLYFGLDDLAFTVGGAVVGLIGQGIGDAITVWRGGEMSGWEDYAGAAIGGAAGGEALLYTGPIGAGAIGGAVANLSKQGFKNLSGKQEGFDATSLAIDTALGGATGLVRGAKIPGVTTGRGSHNQVFKQIVTKAQSNQISSIKPKTALKMFSGHAANTGLVPGAGAAGAAAGTGFLPTSEERCPPQSDARSRFPMVASH